MIKLLTTALPFLVVGKTSLSIEDEGTCKNQVDDLKSEEQISEEVQKRDKLWEKDLERNGLKNNYKSIQDGNATRVLLKRDVYYGRQMYKKRLFLHVLCIILLVMLIISFIFHQIFKVAGSSSYAY